MALLYLSSFAANVSSMETSQIATNNESLNMVVFTLQELSIQRESMDLQRNSMHLTALVFENLMDKKVAVQDTRSELTNNPTKIRELLTGDALGNLPIHYAIEKAGELESKYLNETITLPNFLENKKYSNEFIELLLSMPELQKTLTMKNNEGKTPLDLAPKHFLPGRLVSLYFLLTNSWPKIWKQKQQRSESFKQIYKLMTKQEYVEKNN